MDEEEAITLIVAFVKKARINGVIMSLAEEEAYFLLRDKYT